MSVGIKITRNARNSDEAKKLLEIALRKLRNKTKDICLEYNRNQYYEKPCVEHERIRRKREKERRRIELLKERYGKRWEDYNTPNDNRI